MVSIPADYSSFSFAPSSKDRPPPSSRRSSRSSSLPPPSLPRPPRRRTQELNGPTVHCPSQLPGLKVELDQARRDPAGPATVSATGPGPATSNGALSHSPAPTLAPPRNPATDHPLSAEEALDILARVERDVGRSDWNLRKIKGSLRAFAGLSPTEEDLRATTVSPQEAFLDYSEVDSQLHDAGLDSKSSLFAPLPGQALHQQGGAQPPAGQGHRLHPRAPVHTFEGSHRAYSPSSLGSKGDLFPAPKNAVSWSGTSDGSPAADDGPATPEDQFAPHKDSDPDRDPDPDPDARASRLDYFGRNMNSFPSPHYWPGPPVDHAALIKPVDGEVHRRQAEAERVEALKFAGSDVALPSPGLDGPGVAGGAGLRYASSAKLAQHLGLPGPGSSGVGVGAGAGAVYGYGAQVAGHKRAYEGDHQTDGRTGAGPTLSFTFGGKKVRVDSANGSPFANNGLSSDPAQYAPLPPLQPLYGHGGPISSGGSANGSPYYSHTPSGEPLANPPLSSTLLPGLVPNAPPKGRKPRRPSAPPLPPLPYDPSLPPDQQPQHPPPPPGQLRCPLMLPDGASCGVMFRRPYDLARHRETVHGEGGGNGKIVKSWTCAECKGVFSRKDALIRHSRIVQHNSGL